MKSISHLRNPSFSLIKVVRMTNPESSPVLVDVQVQSKNECKVRSSVRAIRDPSMMMKKQVSIYLITTDDDPTPYIAGSEQPHTVTILLQTWDSSSSPERSSKSRIMACALVVCITLISLPWLLRSPFLEIWAFSRRFRSGMRVRIFGVLRAGRKINRCYIWVEHTDLVSYQSSTKSSTKDRRNTEFLFVNFILVHPGSIVSWSSLTPSSYLYTQRLHRKIM